MFFVLVPVWSRKNPHSRSSTSFAAVRGESHDLVIKVGHFELFKNEMVPVGTLAIDAVIRATGTPGLARIGAKRCPRREGAVRFRVDVQRQADLLQVVFALGQPPGFAAGVDRRQQQRN